MIKYLGNVNFTESKAVSMLKKKAKEQWPESGDTYWFIGDCGKVSYDVSWGDEEDQFRLKTHNVFRTEEEAEKKLEELMEEK